MLLASRKDNYTEAIDMMLAFVASYAGEAAAGKSQAAAEYYPLPKVYANFDKHPKAPVYLKQGPTTP